MRTSHTLFYHKQERETYLSYIHLQHTSYSNVAEGKYHSCNSKCCKREHFSVLFPVLSNLIVIKEIADSRSIRDEGRVGSATNNIAKSLALEY